MRSLIGAGILAGLVSAAVLAAVDCSLLVIDSGGFWLRFTPGIVAVVVFLLFGGLFGALMGFFWSLLGRSSSRDVATAYKTLVVLLTFVTLTLFCWAYLYDYGWGYHSRGIGWHYAAAVLVCLIASSFVWLVAVFLLSLYRRKTNRIALVTTTVLAVVLLEIVLIRFVHPGISKTTEGTPDPTVSAPNIVLLVMDTTRLDALSRYGNPRQTTPSLDHIASEAIVFTRAYAPASWTSPSHASMFTGLYPSEHGTYSNQILLQRNSPTIAEVLSEAGYDSFFLSAKDVLRKSYGYDRGFGRSVTVNVEDKASLFYERLLEKFIRKVQSLTPITVDMAIAWLRSRETSRPYFLFINLNDTHTKYVPREPFFSKCSASIDLSFVDVAKVHKLVESVTTLSLYNKGKVEVNIAELDYIRCLYDSEARYMDEYIGRLFDRLRALGGGRNTVGIITSDHGEMLGEHDLMSHGEYLYNELIHVPLIIWGTPETGTVDDPVTLVNLFPTMLDIADVEMKELPTTMGGSVLESSEDTTIFAESWAKGIARRALIRGEYKYVWESTGEQYLFNLAEDPTETNNLVETMPDFVQVLHNDLSSRFDLSQKFVDTDEIDEDVLKTLRTLGYVH